MTKEEDKTKDSDKGKVGDKKDKDIKNKKIDKSVDSKLNQVIKGIDTLAGAVGKLVELQTVKPLEETIPIKENKETFTPKLDDETYPEEYIPPVFRKIVDDVLSKEFGLKIVDFPDRTDFQISIVVPEKYSSVSKEDRSKGMEDIRSRIIPRALGENGIKEWCGLIRVNLNKFYSKEGVKSPFSVVK